MKNSITLKFIRISLLAVLLASALTGLAPTNARASLGIVRYASPTGLASGSCDTWANACTLAYVMGKAISGDQIWVKAGTHRPHASDRTKSFTLKNGVAVYGGFAGTETALNQRNISANLTILSGDIGTPNVHTDNSYHVVVGSGVNNTAKLDGVRIIRGRASGLGTNGNGGGIYINAGSPTIKTVTFTLNFASQNGGGLYNLNGAPIISFSAFSSNIATLNGGGAYNEGGLGSFTKTVFTNNDAEFGGGMYNTTSKPALKDLSFTGNSAGSGGGMSNNVGSNIEMSNLTFANNAVSGSGGGMHNSGSNVIITNATFNNNSADNGGGMINADSSDAELTNVTFSGNAATINGGGIFNFNSDPRLINVILWDDIAANGAEVFNNGSAPTIKASVVEGGCPVGTTCTFIVTADPHLLALTNNGGFTQTMALDAGSSAINAGANSFCAADDQRGTLRPQGGVCDIGAYENEEPPTVFSITRGDAGTTNAASVSFSVNFSEPVQNVGTEDFTLTKSGSITGESVASVSGTGARYQVTVNTGTGSGALRLDVPNAASILDMAGNPLTNLPFTSGDEYVVDKDAPTVVSIVRSSPNPTSGQTVIFTVTFSESVQGFSGADFALTQTGDLTGSSIRKVSGSATLLDVLVDVGTGNGTLRLDVPNTATITDFANNSLGGLPFVNGEAYNVNKKLLARSLGAEDGWVLESGENTSVGGTMDDTATTLRIGDDAMRKQYRSVISFDTQSLPDNATITSVTLKVKQQGIVGGGDPMTDFQGFMLDIRNGLFGTSSLQLGDWQAGVSGTVGPFSPSLSNGLYIFDLTASQNLINKLATGGGRTQIRIRFKVADDNNSAANFLSLFSGNAGTANRPLLIVEFFVP